MADEPKRKTGYPYMSVNVWAELRRAFAKNVPAKVTTTYLQSVFKSSAKAAANLLPQLKTAGLIDSDGAPLELAKRYRLDTEYQACVGEILERVYPTEVRDLYPGPEEDLQSVANWFMLDTGGGQIGSTSQARFYLMLVSGQLPTAEARVPRKSPTEGKAKNPVKAKPSTDAVGARDTTVIKNSTLPPPPADLPALPGLHLDIQIHIDAEATVEQIDAVFASMARHIYKRG